VLAGLIELFSGKHEEACARVPKLVELSRNVTEISMTAIVQHSCGYLEDTITSYERVFSANPHYSSWVKYITQSFSFECFCLRYSLKDFN